MLQTRSARVPAFAKINLSLKVLHKRHDQYHEIRTIFQTISVADAIEVAYTPARTVSVEADCSIEIPDNIAVRAAKTLMDEAGIRGHVRLRIQKEIPMGGGLGGGSSDAAAVLLALPALAGKHVPVPELTRIGATLGSDVPFFLCGGTALGLGRGEEIYPFAQPKPSWAILLAPGIHVSTPAAYRALNRHLTVTEDSRIMNSFQSLSWEIGEGVPVRSWRGFCQNDFEEVVFRQYPQIQRLKKKLIAAGACLTLMTGSGSALFGFFDTRADTENAAMSLPDVRSVVFRTVSRARYRALWYRSLREHAWDKTWPPQSRYVK
ncbi:MAG TPA: 4-(cytidine 5'-diphospho)-2-C-methyl-D-erythritol kinase [Bryobacteraceae bacterium]|nr:4-(cytidine 5'-diphospho)-2-C-methyl-D-erythritol kinase [Bryobacteraceae bacterium]